MIHNSVTSSSHTPPTSQGMIRHRKMVAAMWRLTETGNPVEEKENGEESDETVNHG